MGKVGRRAFAGLIAAAGLCAALGAQAQAWPAKPVKFVVGAAAGGSASDAATRFFADRIREATGQAMLVENKPGADGNVAAEIVVRSPADGYTALVTGNNTHAANIHLYKALNYDPYKDFAPVTTYARALVEMEAAAQAIFFSSGFHKQAVGDFLAKRPLAYDWDRFEKDGK